MTIFFRDELSDRLDMAQNARWRAQEMQLHRERVAAVKRPTMWRDLLRVLDYHVRMHQGLHHDIKLSWRLDDDKHGFIVRRAAFPCASVTVRFVDQRVIQLRFAYRKSDETETIEWEEHIGFTVDELDRVQYEHKSEPLMDATAAALIVLRPLIDPTFTPPATP